MFNKSLWEQTVCVCVFFGIMEDFNRELQKMSNNSRKSSVFTRERLNNYIEIINTVMENPNRKKCNKAYYLLRKYRIVREGEEVKLVCKKSGTSFVSLEEVYAKIREVHETFNHCGEKRIFAELRKTYANINIRQIKMFITKCNSCNKQRRQRKKGKRKFISNSKFGERGYIEVKEMPPTDEGFGYILMYRDVFSKFLVYKPIRDRHDTDEIRQKLWDIFSIFGAPKILLGEETMKLSELLKGDTPWPWKIAYQINYDNTLKMNVDERNPQWYECYRGEQWKRNSEGPYEVVFGCDPTMDMNIANQTLFDTHHEVRISF